MAEPKKTFPMLPIAHWWSLRTKFKQSMPGNVTDNYIATVLNMEANSARANVLPFLRVLGIVDHEGRTGARAKAWRDDERYAEVCREMLIEVYPDELIQAVPNPATDRATAERWFANHTGAGEPAVKRMAALYTVLTEADASKQPDSERRASAKDSKHVARQSAKAQQKPSPSGQGAESRETGAIANNGASSGAAAAGPDLNINVQVHISADASADQIEQIFASMAKHIYRRS